MQRAVISFALFSQVYGASLTMPPPMPAAFPSVDQSVLISGSFLTDSLVTNALEYVSSAVSASILAITPSKYNSGSNVTYIANPSATCYWPSSLCARSADTANYKADIFTCPTQNDWGLTYDDGPTVNTGNDTAGILKALESANLKATFFIVGSNAIQYPSQILASYQAGHQIAVHTWTHHPLTSLTNAQIVAEIKYTEAIIYKTIGVVPKYFRPPYGDIDDRVRAIISALGYRTVLWTSSPNRDSTDADQVDSKAATSAKVAAIIKSWFVVQAGFISLEHDIVPFTSFIAIQAINSIKATANFPLNPKTVAQCLGDANPYWSASIPNVTTSVTSATVSVSATAQVSGNPKSNGGTSFIPEFFMMLPMLAFA